MRYYLRIFLVFILFCSCDAIINETYHKMTMDKRRMLSAEYTQLAKRLERGSPDNMKLLEKAIRINPSNDQAHYELSIPYLYNGLFEKWNYHIDRAIDLNAQAWQGMRGYYKLLYLKDFGSALFDLDATDTLTIEQTDYAHNMSMDYLRGLCYLGLKNYDKSKEYFQIFVDKETVAVGEKFVDENAFLYLGILDAGKGFHQEAINYFDRAIKFEEGLADVYYHKAKCLVRLNRIQEAKEQIGIAKLKFSEGYYLRGYMYRAQEQIYSNDIETLEQLIYKAIAENQI